MMFILIEGFFSHASRSHLKAPSESNLNVSQPAKSLCIIHIDKICVWFDHRKQSAVPSKRDNEISNWANVGCHWEAALNISACLFQAEDKTGVYPIIVSTNCVLFQVFHFIWSYYKNVFAHFSAHITKRSVLAPVSSRTPSYTQSALIGQLTHAWASTAYCVAHWHSYIAVTELKAGKRRGI